MLKAVSSIVNAIGALNYDGTWNATTNTPTIVSSVGVKGDYYVVSVAGTTSINGLSNWGIGDWIVFNGSVWQRVEGGADLNGINLTVQDNSTLGETSSDITTINSTTTFNASPVISVTDNTNAALRITQLGTGNALLVEDSTNPDSTPFVITADGRFIHGHTSALSPRAITFSNQFIGLDFSGSAPLSLRYSNDASPTGYEFSKTRSTTPSGNAIVSSGDSVGLLVFSADDGTQYVQAASILAAVDGTPGTNDMPGRLVFSTTADGASSPTERVRISSTGQTTFNNNAVISVTDNTNAALRITQLGTGNALLVEDSTNPDASPFVIDANGKVVLGKTSAVGSGLLQTYVEAGTSFVSRQSSTDADAVNWYLQKARGTTASPTSVNNNDNIGAINFQGYDGTAFLTSAFINAVVDGVTGTNDMPSRLMFHTTADGASTPTERLRINNAGEVTIANLAGVGSRAVNASATGVLSAASDSSLKEEVTDAHIAGLAEILQIHPKMYRWKDDIANRGDNAAIELGFFANDVAPIIPSAAPKGNDGLYGFYDRSIIAALVKAIQEQQSFITTMSAQIEELKLKGN
jgi:hypothetical protein